MINILQKYKQIIKYLIAGGTSALVDLVLLYILTDILGVWYLISASLAFVAAFFVSFFLQKFWTFRDVNKEKMYKQMGVYSAVALINFILNAALMYVLVDGFRVWYMLSQFAASGLIACESYFVYKLFVFNNNEPGAGKIKVLIATGIFPPDIGGPATMLGALAEALADKGMEVKVVTYSDQNNIQYPCLAGRQAISNIQLNSKKQIPKKLEIKRVVRNKISGVRYLQYFWQMLKLAIRADVIYVTDTYSVGYFAYLIKKFTGKPYVVRFAGDSAWETAAGAGWTADYITDFQHTKYDKRVEKLKERRKKILVNADAVIAVSNFMAGMAETIGVSREKITVIYNAVDFFPAPPKRQDPLNPILVYAGRLVSWKGVAMLIQAVQELKEYRPNIIFEILGDGPEEAKLKGLVNNLGLSQNIIFRGRVSEEASHKIFARCTIFVLNTNYEGLPHSVLNAMRSGLPVITTPIGGNLEVVQDGINGLLAPYNKLADWLKAINKLLDDEGLRQKFSNNGLETVKNFKWSEAVEKTSALIRGLSKQ